MPEDYHEELIQSANIARKEYRDAKKEGRVLKPIVHEIRGLVEKEANITDEEILRRANAGPEEFVAARTLHLQLDIERLEKENQHLRQCLNDTACKFQELKERYYRFVKNGGNNFTQSEQNVIDKFWEEAAKENFNITDFMDALQGLDTNDEHFKA